MLEKMEVEKYISKAYSRIISSFERNDTVGEIDLNQRMVENLYRHISVVSQNFVKYYLTLRKI